MALSQTEIDAAPKVTLGGREFPIPTLAFRQCRVVIPAVMKLRNVNLAALSEADFDLMADVVFHALTRATPDLTRDQFLDLPITLPELLAAFPVIADQTGAMKKASAAGEAKAVTTVETSTSTS